MEVVVAVWVPDLIPGLGGALETGLHAVVLAALAGLVLAWRLRGAAWREGQGRPEAGSVRAARLGAAGVLIMGLLLTGAVVHAALRQAEQEAAARFHRLSERLVGEAQRRVNQVRYGLAGAKGVYAASKSVERGEFAAYVASRELPDEFPGAIGMGFIERVPRAGLEAFVAAERADGAPEFSVWGLAPPGSALAEAADLYVIKHCFPQERNGPAWGLDIGSEAERRGAAERAVDTGRPAITGRLSLVQDGQQRVGFLYLLPVYAKGAAPNTPEARRAALVGLVYAPILLEEALQGVGATADGLVDFEIFDGAQTEKGIQLYDDDHHLDHAAGAIGRANYTGRMFQKTSTIEVGGRTWTISTSTLPAFDATVDRSAARVLGVAGGIISVLAAAFASALLSGRSRALSLASAMTADLAAAKSSAERLAEIARRTSNAVVVFDTRGRVEWVNEGFTRISGYALDEVRGLPAGDRLRGVRPQADGADAGAEPGLGATIAQAAGGGLVAGASLRSQLVNRHKDGRAYTVEVEVAPLRDAGGGLTGYMTIESDITERVEAQRRLAESKLAAEAASRAKSAFLANMSHEIRTPLTAILGYADLLREEEAGAGADPRRLECIDTIRGAGAHLLTVINDILDLSKIEADRMTIEAVPLHLPGTLLEIEGLMRPRAAGKGVALQLTLEPTLPDRILSDPTRLRQILLNLTGNAIKFTEAGGVSIVAGAVGGPAGARLVVDIVDTGPGLTALQAGRLFEAFGQADASVTRKHGGTGLGLTISRRLAGLMGGEVTLERSAPGEGSTFRLTLPLHPAPGAAPVGTWPAAPAEGPGAPGGRAEPGPGATPAGLAGRILLAEDGLDNQRLICAHLRRAGAEVDVAGNGVVALRMVEAAAAAGAPYGLLLTDMQMPEMDGCTLATELRRRGSTMAIIALTAHAMAEDRAKCLAAGCDDYATKPIDKPALLAACVHWLGRRSLAAA